MTKPLEISRDFKVPVEKLFSAFTTPEAIKAWWWPKDMHAEHVDLDFREGGKYFIDMKGYDQGGGGMTGEFKKIDKNKRIVMTDHFADENGKAIAAKDVKIPGNWQDDINITFEFESTDKNITHFKLSQTGIPDEARKDCIQGWSESFDKLEQFIKH